MNCKVVSQTTTASGAESSAQRIRKAKVLLVDDDYAVRQSLGLALQSEHFEVIEAQQQLFPAENILAQTRRDQLIAIVRLYKALGGGWALYTEPPALPPPWYKTIP